MTNEERRELHALLQAHAPVSPALAGGVLTRWVFLGEWMVPSHDLAFWRISGQADGRPLTTWEVDGFLHTATWRAVPTLGPLIDDQGDSP